MTCLVCWYWVSIVWVVGMSQTLNDFKCYTLMWSKMCVSQKGRQWPGVCAGTKQNQNKMIWIALCPCVSEDVCLKKREKMTWYVHAWKSNPFWNALCRNVSSSGPVFLLDLGCLWIMFVHFEHLSPSGNPATELWGATQCCHSKTGGRRGQEQSPRKPAPHGQAEPLEPLPYSGGSSPGQERPESCRHQPAHSPLPLADIPLEKTVMELRSACYRVQSNKRSEHCFYQLAPCSLLLANICAERTGAVIWVTWMRLRMIWET